MNTLSSFRHKNKFTAEDGSNGRKQNMTGRTGADTVLLVPPGTMVFDDENNTLLGDLVDEGQQLIIAEGGRGGRGNTRFKSSVNQVPRIAEKGEPAQERSIRLELKLIADVGIIGVPNAGKSTFLSVVTKAKPKIADYPFTTLEPNLGVANIDEDTSLVLADIPGLIEGAHMGIGLGHEFLRHIQRTRVLIHLLDGLAEDPVLDFIQINSELALFDPDLVKKPQLVVLNKCDLPEVQSRWSEIERRLLELENSVPVEGRFSMSAVAGTNVRHVLGRASQIIDQLPELPRIFELPVYRFDSDPRDFKITRQDDGWRVSGESIERAAAMTYWRYYQSVRRFQRILETLGIDQALRDAGVKPGDTVYIGEKELEWEE